MAFAASVIERLWRSLKYEAIYLHEIADGLTARRLIRDWIVFCNAERPHAALGGRTPAEAYRGETHMDMMDKPLRALPTSPQAQQQQQKDRFKRVFWRPELQPEYTLSRTFGSNYLTKGCCFS